VSFRHCKQANVLNSSQAVFPAFFSLYVSRERRSSVQAMQSSNGLSDPIGLWMGHLMFDSIFSVTLATVIIAVFATASNQFHGLALLVSFDIFTNSRYLIKSNFPI
jgi:hypothetical protein